MAFRILEAGTPRRNLAAEFAGNFTSGLMEGGFQGLERKKSSQLASAENEALKAKGIDLSGISDPKMRQQALVQALQGAKAKELELMKQEAKNQRIRENQSFLSQIFGNKKSLPQNQANQITESPEEFENRESQFDASEITPEQIAHITAQDPTLGRMIQSEKDLATREKREEIRSKERLEAEGRQARTNKEKAFFKFNEPKLSEIAGIERKIQIDNARFTKLGDLFSDNSKFPHQTLAALMTKDGQINDVAYSQLTPEAQEAVKLIIDSTSGIKDTYGARVTNFDLQTYLRKLPSLLTSPEGRQRVIKDLKSINDINSVYNEGIQDVFEKAGGSDKISFSEAERKFKREYGSELQRKIDKFLEPPAPKNNQFKELPSAKQYLGKKMKNPETGEIFISDGITWKPYEE